MINDEELKDVAILVYANKQDLKGVMSIPYITEKLNLSSITRQIWKIQPACAANGDGLYEGFDWLSRNITSVRN